MILKTPFSSCPAICSCLDAGYSDSRESTSLSVHLSVGKQVSDKNVIWTYSRCFSCCLRLSSFATEGANTENACTRGICAGNAFFAVGFYIKDAGPEGTDMEGACMENVYIGVIGWYCWLRTSCDIKGYFWKDDRSGCWGDGVCCENNSSSFIGDW